MSEPQLCKLCEGNGVLKIPGGVATCKRCGGHCWEPAEPSVPLSAIRALVQQWREAAQFEQDEMSNTQRAQTLDQCADELAAMCPAEDQK